MNEWNGWMIWWYEWLVSLNDGSFVEWIRSEWVMYEINEWMLNELNKWIDRVIARTRVATLGATGTKFPGNARKHQKSFAPSINLSMLGDVICIMIRIFSQSLCSFLKPPVDNECLFWSKISNDVIYDFNTVMKWTPLWSVVTWLRVHSQTHSQSQSRRIQSLISYLDLLFAVQRNGTQKW